MVSKMEESLNTLPNEKILFIALQINILFVVMNTTMFNVALPAISSHFTLTPSSVSWVVMSYSLVFAIGTVTFGRLADQLPIKNLVTIGLLMLGTGSLLGMFAFSFPVLIIARVIQACGASAIPGLGMVIVSKYIPINRRGAAMGRLMSVATLGFGMGPMVGGILIEYFGWSVLFFITVLGMVMIPVYLKQLPSETIKKTTFDIQGLFLLAIGVLSLILAVTSKNIVFLLGIPFLLIFWQHIKKHADPIITPTLLAYRPYTLYLTLNFLLFFLHFATMFLLPLLLSSIHDLSALRIGAILFPGAIIASVLSIYIGRLLDKINSYRVILSGLVLMLVGLFLFSNLGFASPWYIIGFYFFTSIGFAIVTTGIPKDISILLKPSEIGIGMGFLQLIQFFGGAFGVGLSGLLLDTFSKQEIQFAPFWKGIHIEYSSTFSLHIVICLLAIFVYYQVSTLEKGKKVKEH